jgi:hypothetical protein
VKRSGVADGGGGFGCAAKIANLNIEFRIVNSELAP